MPITLFSEAWQPDSTVSLHSQQRDPAEAEAVLHGLRSEQQPEGLLAEHVQLHDASEGPVQQQGSAAMQTGNLQQRQSEASTQASQHAGAHGHLQQPLSEAQPERAQHADDATHAQHHQDDAQILDHMASVTGDPQRGQHPTQTQPPHESSAAASASATVKSRAPPILPPQLAQHPATAAGDAEYIELTMEQPTDSTDPQLQGSTHTHTAVSVPEECTAHGSAAAIAGSASVIQYRQNNAAGTQQGPQQPSEQQGPVQSGQEEPTLDVFAQLLRVSAT